MKSSTKKLQILLLIVAHALLSCEVTVDLDKPDFDPVMTFNYFYGNEPFFAFTGLKLYENQSFLDSRENFQSVEDALITLYENGEFVGYADEYDPGVYRFHHTPSGGNSYKIVATATGLPQIETTDTTPELIESVTIKSLEPFPTDNFYKDRTYRLKYTINDPLGQNYYDVRLYVTYSETSKNGQSHSAETILFREIDGDLTTEVSNGSSKVFSDVLFDGKEHTKIIEFDYSNQLNLNSHRTDIVLNLRHCSESY